VGLRSESLRLVRSAAGSVPEPGWPYRRASLFRRHDNGYWAQIVVLDAVWTLHGPPAAVNEDDELELGLTAGVALLTRRLGERDQLDDILEQAAESRRRVVLRTATRDVEHRHAVLLADEVRSRVPP
jgi:hypothetical protein